MSRFSSNIVGFTLLAFLFSGIGTASLLPVLITSLGHSHPIFISEYHHKIQLTLHHSGNHDQHEAREGVDHQHDLFDAMLGVSKNDSGPHTDHTIELPSLEEKIPTTGKNLISFKSLPLVANTSVFSVSPQQSFERRLFHVLPPIDPRHKSHPSTILVI